MGTKIVSVDDNRLGLQSVSAALASDGYQVWATESTEEAVALARAVEPDVLVTDYRMPQMDGVSLPEQVAKSAGVPLMLGYSATPLPREHLSHLVQGVRWFAKAVDHRALLVKLTDLLERGVGAS